MSSQRKLSDNEKRWILDDAFTSIPIDETLKKVDIGRRQFTKYLKDNPEFDAEYQQALIDSCPYLENDILNATKKFKESHKLAAVYVNAVSKVLAFRNPQRYGAKIDLSVNQTVSIRVALEGANDRIKQVLDVKASVSEGEKKPALVAGSKDKNKA